MMKRRNSTFSLRPKDGVTQWLGFDLDMTLIKYRIDVVAKHTYTAAVKHMSQALGYPLWVSEVCPHFQP